LTKNGVVICVPLFHFPCLGRGDMDVNVRPNIERHVPPKDVASNADYDEGNSGHFKLCDGKTAVDTGNTFDEEPNDLNANNCFGEAIGITAIIDGFFHIRERDDAALGKVENNGSLRHLPDPHRFIKIPGLQFTIDYKSEPPPIEEHSMSHGPLVHEVKFMAV